MESKKLKAQEILNRKPSLVIIDDYHTIPVNEQEMCEEWLRSLCKCKVLFISGNLLSLYERTSVRRERFSKYVELGGMPKADAVAFWNCLIERKARDKKLLKQKTAENVISTYGTNPFFLFRGVFAAVNAGLGWENVSKDIIEGDNISAKRIFDQFFESENIGNHERDVFRALSLFVPSASNNALAEVSAVEEKSFKRALIHLYNEFLIKPASKSDHHTIYNEIFAEFIRNHMNNDSPSDDFQDRFVEYYSDFVEKHSNTTPEHFEALENEKDNIFKAMDIAFDNKAHRNFSRMLSALGRLHNGYFELYGYGQATHDFGIKGIESAKFLKDKALEGNFICMVAGSLMKRGKNPEAKKLLQPFIVDEGKTFFKSSYINALHLMGLIAFSTGDYSKAESFYRKELNASAETEDKSFRGIANSTHELGRLMRTQGHFPEAAYWYEQSLEARRMLKNDDGSDDIVASAPTLHEIGVTPHMRGDWDWYHGNSAQARQFYDQALDAYSKSLVLKKKLKMKAGEANTRNELADINRILAGYAETDLQKSQLFKKAHTELNKSLRIKKKLFDELGLAIVYYTQGRLELDEGNFQKAEYYADLCYQRRKNTDDKSGIAGCHYLFGLIAEQNKNFEAALASFEKAGKMWSEIKSINKEYADLGIKRIRKEK